MTQRRTLGWFIVAAAAVSTFILLGSFPPATGYYCASAFEHLDGSSGYLHFHDGLVDVVNIGGQLGDSRRRIGTYKTSSRRLTVHLDFKKVEDHSAIVGLFGIRWVTDIAPDTEGAQYSRREVVPWILKKLRQVKARSSNQPGAVNGGTAPLFQVEYHWPAATDPDR